MRRGVVRRGRVRLRKRHGTVTEPSRNRYGTVTEPSRNRRGTVTDGTGQSVPPTKSTRSLVCFGPPRSSRSRTSEIPDAWRLGAHSAHCSPHTHCPLAAQEGRSPLTVARAIKSDAGAALLTRCGAAAVIVPDSTGRVEPRPMPCPVQHRDIHPEIGFPRAWNEKARVYSSSGAPSGAGGHRFGWCDLGVGERRRLSGRSWVWPPWAPAFASTSRSD